MFPFNLRYMMTSGLEVKFIFPVKVPGFLQAPGPMAAPVRHLGMLYPVQTGGVRL